MKARLLDEGIGQYLGISWVLAAFGDEDLMLLFLRFVKNDCLQPATGWAHVIRGC